MRFALGHSFNLEDLFYNFPLKKLKLTCAECYELIGELHRNKLAKRIFIECFKLVIQLKIQELIKRLSAIIPTQCIEKYFAS